MTYAEIEARMQRIKDLSGDSKMAHAAGDKLREDFIRYVSTLSSPIKHKAELILSTNDIEFERRCS